MSDTPHAARILVEASQRKIRARLLAIYASLALCALASLALGRYPIALSALPKLLLPDASGVAAEMERARSILLRLRLPRVLLACMVGGGLSVSGAAYQSVFHNPMASPDLLGASAGAAFGAALALINGWGMTAVMGCAFAFGLLAVALAFAVGARVRGGAALSLILSGIVAGSLCSAGTSYLKLVADPNNQLPAITYWLMGSLSGASLRDVRFAAAPMFVGVGLLLLLRWRLNTLTLGDEEAAALGVNVRRARGVVIIAATLTTSAAIAVSGSIGWVGLVVPHIARRWFGSDARASIPAALLLGALFLLVVDGVSRTLWATEVPLGILTSAIGAPFFLFWLTRAEGAQ